MALGMNVVTLIVAGGATMIVLLMHLQATNDLHTSTARQTGQIVLQTLNDTRQALLYTAQSAPGAADLERLMVAYPAVKSASLIDNAGGDTLRVPGSAPAEDWREHPAWEAITAGQPYSGLDEDRSLVMAVPAEGGMLVARLDPQALWQLAVTPVVGEGGYTYVVDEHGGILATAPGQPLPDERQPADFTGFIRARKGEPEMVLYRGLEDDLVLGRGTAIPDTSWYVMTETPLTDFTPLIVRLVALWVLALGLTFLVGEWMIRRILRMVLTPLDMLQKAARAVGGGDYRYRVRLPDSTDRELTALGNAFNEMTTRLQDSQEQIDAYTHEMEEIVDLRARELSRKALQLEVAAEVSGKIATILDPRMLIEQVIDLIQQRFRIYHVDILTVNPDTGLILSGRSRDGLEIPPISIQDENTSVIAWVARFGQTLYVPDVGQEPRYRRLSLLPASQSELAIPLKFGGRAIGVLNLEAEHRHAFPRDEIAVLESLANEIAVSMHNAQVFTALETANRDLAQATLQAKQANLLKSRFLLNASHKLRTPLNAIIGYSETILSGMYGDIPDKAIDRQRRILDNGRHLQALIEDILDLSSIETGSMELNLSWVEVEPLLDEVMNAARALHQTGYPDHDLDLRLDIDGALPSVRADLDRLRYILINLLGNAVKFTESGEVVMSATLANGSLLISVRDTGPGIPDDEQTYLFEPFQHQKGSTASEGKGTGLGLPVARLLALMHGGDLTVISTVHRGSTFTLRLPCPDASPAE